MSNIHPPYPWIDRPQLEDIVLAAHDRVPAIVWGLAGVGKSGVCFKAALSPPIIEAYGERRYLIDCEAKDANQLLEAVRQAIWPGRERPLINPDTGLEGWIASKLRGYACAREPALLIFDNAEDVLYRRSVASSVSAFLHRLEPDVGLLVTVRAGQRPDVLGWRSIAVPELSREQGEELFLKVALDFRRALESADEARGVQMRAGLRILIEALDGVTLAIRIIAGLAADNGSAEIGPLLSQLRTELRGREKSDRLGSVWASVALSIKALEGRERELLLLKLLGALPGGIAQRDLETIVPGGVADGANAVIGMGLAQPRDDGERLTTLKPIRECLADQVAIAPDELEYARDHYLAILERGSSRDLDAAAQSNVDRLIEEEAANIDAMVDSVDDKARRCELLLEKGEAEWRTRRYELSRSSFRDAAALARQLQDPARLSEAALGFSGGIEGRGHSFDQGDRERVELLDEALAAIGDDDPALRLRLLTRLRRELHFDASSAGEAKRDQVRAQVEAILPRVEERQSLEPLLQQLEESGPKTVAPSVRLQQADKIIERGHRLGAGGTELAARMLKTFALLEAGETALGRDEIDHCALLATNLKQDEWKVRVMERASLLFEGRFTEARAALNADRGIIDQLKMTAERRLLHQEVVLAMDTGRDPSYTTDIDSRPTLNALRPKVEDLVARLRADEAEKFQVSEDELSHMAYQWWPTWRANLALVLAAAGAGNDADAVLVSLGSPRFERIMPHEYWLQAIAVIAIAASWNYNQDGDADRLERLHGLLAPYHDRSIVPGSVVMNLGSVSTVLGMLAARLHRYSEAIDRLDTGRERNRAIGSSPAVARTELELALLHRSRALSGEPRARLESAASANRCLEIAHELEMDPVVRRANEIRAWAAQA